LHNIPVTADISFTQRLQPEMTHETAFITFHICAVRPVTIKVFITNWCTRELFLMSIKVYIKITTAATCFGEITIIRERTIELAKL